MLISHLSVVFVKSDCDFVAGCKFHTGFRDAWNEVAKDVVSAVKTTKSRYPRYKIVVTGHSLGGAVGTIAAANLRRDGYDADLYTYGSPRVGNGAFADFVTKQRGAEYRVTHLNDLVPRLPPLGLDYRHTSPEYYLSTGKATTIDYAVKDVKICSGDANTDCNAKGILGSILAHANYLLVMTGCNPLFKGFVSDVEDAEEIHLDEEVEARLRSWAELDMQLSATLGQGADSQKVGGERDCYS